MCEKLGWVYNDINILCDKVIKLLLVKFLLKKCKMCCLLSFIKNLEKMYFFFLGVLY